MSEPAREQPKPNRRFSWRMRIGVILVGLIGLGIFVMGNWFAGKPEGLGVENGRLSKCPDSPNCICSQEDRESHHIEPLKYKGDGDAAFARLVKVFQSWPRAKTVTQTDTYLHVEFTTPVLRFVDDGEFLLVKENRAIQMRSASRVGHSDMGKNRERMEKLRAAFDSSQNQPEN